MKKVLQTSAWVAPAILVLFQAAWLGMAWLTGSPENRPAALILLGLALVFGLAADLMPGMPFERLDGFFARLAARPRWALGVLLGALALAGVIYAAVQPVMPDEAGIYQICTELAKKGLGSLPDLYAKYSWLGTQHPPLVIMTYGLALSVFGQSLFVMRMASLVFGLAALGFTWLLGRELYTEREGLLGGLILLACPMVLRLSAAGMTDMPITCFYVLVMLQLARLARKPGWRRAFGLAAFLLVGMLVKYTMVFGYAVVVVFFLVDPGLRQAKRYLVGGLGVPVLGGLAWLGIAARMGALERQARTLLEYGTVVLRTDLGRRFLVENLTSRIPSALGAPQIPLALAGAWQALRRRENGDRLLLVWVFVMWIGLMVTLPDHRYFVPSFPALALLAARGLRDLPGATRGRVLALVFLFALEAWVLFAGWDRSTFFFVPPPPG
jgi:4-amino-4-deoxy-L-arabinose transferase-like glycosyltransferase